MHQFGAQITKMKSYATGNILVQRVAYLSSVLSDYT